MIRIFNKILLLVILVFTYCCQTSGSRKSWEYPQIKPSNVIEQHHGNVVLDPYRDLEQLDHPETKNWIQQQNEFYKKTINSIPNIDSLEKELNYYNSLDAQRVDVPRAAGKKIFYKKRNIEKNQQVICFKNGLEGIEIELFNTESLDSGDYNIEYFEPSYNGKFLAFGLSQRGDEMSDLFILDVEFKTLLNDKIPRAMFGHPQWLPDNSGFFYNQLVEVDVNDAALFENSKVKLHILGENVEEDKDIFSKENNPDLSLKNIDIPVIYTHPTSGNVLSAVYSGSNVYVSIYSTSLQELISSSKMVSWNKVIKEVDKVDNFTFLEDKLYVISHRTNSNGTFEKLSLQSQKERIVLKEGEKQVLQGLIQSKDGIYVKVLENGINELFKFDLKDHKVKKLEVPFQGTIDLGPSLSIPTIYQHHSGLFIITGSWNKEWQIFYYKQEDDKFIDTNLRQKNFGEKLENIIYKEVEVTGHDGVKIPLSLIYLDQKIKENNPTILYSYGAYGISINPFFDPSLLSWLNRGGIYAVAHVRGGGEKGYDWYMGGYKNTKSNSWKDLISCAEYLIEHNFTSPDKLAVEGESAGGITVGRAIIERPDLFKAAVISAGALNPVRDETTSNTLSVAEFGSVKDSIGFKNLYDMDVYHNIKENVEYPSVFLTVV